MEEARLPRVLDDDHALVSSSGTHDLKWILVSSLSVCRSVNEVVQGIEEVDVVVVGGGAERVRPEERNETAVGGNHVVCLAAKIVQPPQPFQNARCRSPIDEITLPGSRGPVVLVSRIGCGRKIQRT